MSIVEDGEDQARRWWDTAGRTVHPSDRRERTALIVSTDGLATAVAAALGEQEIAARADQARVDPHSDSTARVITVATTQHGREVVIPAFPAASQWRVYARPAPGDEIIETITVTADVVGPDGWVPATTIAAHLADHLG